MQRINVKRIAKIFILGVLAVLILVAGVAIFVRIKYPAERLRQMLIAALAENLHLQAQIESLSFHLFSGFTIENLTLAAVEPKPAALPASYQTALRIDEVSLSYRWRSLFARRLDIDAITIARPVFSYWQGPDNSTNIDALLAALDDSTAVTLDTAAASLPVTIDLRTIQLHGLQINTAFAAAVDTQFLALGPLDFTIADLVVDRAAKYRGDYALSAESARLHYTQTASAAAPGVKFECDLRAGLQGRATADSIDLRARLTLTKNRLQWGRTEVQLLPSLHTEAEAQYALAASQLAVPRFTLSLDERELLAARYAMRTQDSTTTFDLNVERGRLDCDYLTRLLHSLKFDFISPALHSLSVSGTLDFSGSELHQAAEGLRYKLALRGENLGYKDSALGLQLDSSQVQISLQSAGADSAEAGVAFDCDFSFAQFDFPIDTVAMHTGPGTLRAKGKLATDNSPEDLYWDLNWRNIAGGSLQSHGTFMSTGVAASAFLLSMRVGAHEIELSPFTADTLQGKVSGTIEVNGKQWNDLQLTSKLQHDTLFYLLEEDRMRFLPYHWTIDAKLAITKNFTDWLFAPGSLQGEPGSANFTARYQTEPGVFRFDLINAALDLSHVLGMVPPSYLEGLHPRLAGLSTANGWMNFQFSSMGELEYMGKFTVNSDKAIFTDDSLGIYADWLELKSDWDLLTNKTTGNYRVTMLASRMPDYIRLPLPRTVADGKIEIDEEAFIIKEGSFTAPAWHLSGSYRVDGKFLQDGMQVQTLVNTDMNAPEFVSLDRGLSLQGRLATRLIIDQFLPDDETAAQPARISGTLRATQLEVMMDSLFVMHDLNADVTFAQDFDFLTMALLPSQPVKQPALANAGEALLLFDVLGELPDHNLTPASQLAIAKLQIGDYEITDVSAKLNLGEGRFDIPQLRMNFLGGNMMGNVLVGFGDGDPDHLTYSTALQVSSIDVSRLRRLSTQVEKGAKLSGDFYLSGIGASPNKLDEVLNNLAGQLNITKIEKKTATNLLEALDPNGTEAGIQRVRFLLKTGWNVKSMTFEIKNGFIYASLAPIKTKPWSALFNLPATLDFARLPVRYFMATE